MDLSARLILDLFRTFFLIGAFTIGGGWAMAPLIRREVVERRGWLTPTDFIDGLAVAQASPGPIAVNIAVFIGYRVGGLLGLAAATLGAVLPSFLAILLVAVFFLRVETSPVVGRFFAGVRPAVLALIILAAWELGQTALKDKWSAGLAVVALVLVAVFRVHPSLVLLGGILLGLALFQRVWVPRRREERLPKEANAQADTRQEERP